MRGHPVHLRFSRSARSRSVRFHARRCVRHGHAVHLFFRFASFVAGHIRDHAAALVLRFGHTHVRRIRTALVPERDRRSVRSPRAGVKIFRGRPVRFRRGTAVAACLSGRRCGMRFRSPSEREIGRQPDRARPKRGQNPYGVHDAHGLRTAPQVERDDGSREEAAQHGEAGGDGEVLHGGISFFDPPNNSDASGGRRRDVRCVYVGRAGGCHGRASLCGVGREGYVRNMSATVRPAVVRSEGFAGGSFSSGGSCDAPRSEDSIRLWTVTGRCGEGVYRGGTMRCLRRAGAGGAKCSVPRRPERSAAGENIRPKRNCDAIALRAIPFCAAVWGMDGCPVGGYGPLMAGTSVRSTTVPLPEALPSGGRCVVPHRRSFGRSLRAFDGEGFFVRAGFVTVRCTATSSRPETLPAGGRSASADCPYSYSPTGT